MKRFTKISLCAAVVAASLATTAQAETANTTVEVYAGLASVMELTCSDVNFGVWRVPTGTRTGSSSGATTITLNDADSATVTAGSSDKVALSNAWTAPKTGTCNVTGSARTDGGSGTASLSDASGNFATSVGTGFENESIDAPSTPLSEGSFTYALTLSSTTPEISGTGTSAFTIQGTMSIPDNLVADNYGGYKSADITVTFDDDSPG